MESNKYVISAIKAVGDKKHTYETTSIVLDSFQSEAHKALLWYFIIQMIFKFLLANNCIYFKWHVVLQFMFQF